MIIPTLNAKEHVQRQLDAISSQSVQPKRFIVLDSQSTDGTADLYAAGGAEVYTVERRHFDHGGTRQRGVELAGDVGIYLLMTQDAIPEDSNAFAALISAFDDPAVGLAYGRQTPRGEAAVIESHARDFNYPPRSRIVRHGEANRFGARAAFCSDSFAAYRRAALEQVGGFPSPIIMGEDQVVAARMLNAGWDIAYVAESKVVHSHDYTIGEDFRRYFDTGVYREQFGDTFAVFGSLTGEGFNFVKSEIAAAAKARPALIPSILVRTAAKLLAFKLGRRYRALPADWRIRMAMNKGYFRRGPDGYVPATPTLNAPAPTAE